LCTLHHLQYQAAWVILIPQSPFVLWQVFNLNRIECPQTDV
jgi:hypothetical protein